MPIAVANTPLSWGVYHGSDHEHPYTLVLDQIAETGYAGVELGPWGYLPTDRDTLWEALRSRKLELASASVALNLLDQDVVADEHVLRVGRLVRALGGRMLLLRDNNRTPPLVANAGRVRAPRLSAGEWDLFAENLNRVAARVGREVGLKTAYQHQCASYVETAEEVRLLMERAGDMVGLCLDTGHWHYAGGDAADALREYGRRVAHIHFSDCDSHIRQFCIDERLDFDEAIQTGVFTELGRGMVDFPRLITMLIRIRYEGWVVVAQDSLLEEPDADRLSAHYNRDYLRKLGI